MVEFLEQLTASDSHGQAVANVDLRQNAMKAFHLGVVSLDIDRLPSEKVRNWLRRQANQPGTTTVLVQLKVSLNGVSFQHFAT